MFSFIHTADIHLDSPLRGLQRYPGAPVDELRSATRQAFTNLIDFAIAQQVSFLVIAGDLYDGDWRDYNTGLFFVACMRRLREAGIAVYVVAGNHDAESRITRYLRLPDNVTLFNTRRPQTVHHPDLPVAVTGQGFAERAVTDDLSQGYPTADPHLFNVAVLHTCLDGKPGHEPYAPCTLSGLHAKGYQYWALGHVHQREIVSDAPWVVFPGNLQGRHARETGPKGCTLVTVDHTSVVSVEHHAMDVVRWARLDISVTGMSALEDIQDACLSAFQRAQEEAEDRLLATRVILHGETPLHRALLAGHLALTEQIRALAADISGAGVWLEKVQLNTSAPRQQDNLRESHPALASLLSSLQEADLDDTVRAAIEEQLLPLKQKLAPVFPVQDGYDPLDDAFSSDTLADVADLLVHRLMTADPD